MDKKELENRKFMETLIIKTPYGGDYSEAYFFDENWQYTTKDKAYHMIIQEYKESGELIHETFMHRDDSMVSEEKKTTKK